MNQTSRYISEAEGMVSAALQNVKLFINIKNYGNLL